MRAVKQLSKHKVLLTFIGMIIVFVCGITTGLQLKMAQNSVVTTSSIVEEKKEVAEETQIQNRTLIEEKKKLTTTYEEIMSSLENVYLKYYATDILKDINKIDPKKVLYETLNILHQENPKEPLTEEKVKETIIKYFGDNFTYTNQSIICDKDQETYFIYGNNQYIYNAKENIHNHEKIYNERVNNYVDVISYQEKDNVITLQAKILYADPCIKECKGALSYYRSPFDTEAIITEKEIGTNQYALLKEEYNTVSANLPVATITFTKNKNNDYYLTNVVIA